MRILVVEDEKGSQTHCVSCSLTTGIPQMRRMTANRT